MIQQYKNSNINDYPLVDPRLSTFKYKLSLCGKFATKVFHCKKDRDHEHELKVLHSKFFCEVRYCSCPDCLVHRFKRTLSTFYDIKRFEGLRSLWHFSIGFPAIPELEFKQNFSKIKKRFEYVLNKYFEKLRKLKINVQAVRVLDFSFKTEGQVYLHYHFAALPIGSNRIRSTLTTMKIIQKKMSSSMRVKTPFHLQSYGLAKKTAVLSYLAIRVSGMYKYDMTKNVHYRHVQANLRGSIEHKKYILLRNVLTESEYLNSFYSKAHFVCIGGLPRPKPHGSNITDGIPLECPIHGELTRKDVRIEVIFDYLINPEYPPPDLSIFSNEKPAFQLVRIL